MKNNKEHATIWTLQSPVVYDTLKDTSHYYVKKAYIDQKFQETAWIFKEAYSAIAALAEQVVPRPEQAESPVWIYPDPQNIQKMSDTWLMKFEVPADSVLFWDVRNWTKILNLSYIGEDADDETRFTKELERHGIHNPSDIFSTAFYPAQKYAVKKSWNRLLEQIPQERCYLHGMVWELRQEWLIQADYIE